MSLTEAQQREAYRRMARKRERMWFHMILAVMIVAALGGCASVKPARVDTNGTIHVPSFDLPDSSLHDETTLNSLRTFRNYRAQRLPLYAECNALREAREPSEVVEACEGRIFRDSDAYHNLRARYRVSVDAQTLGGVAVEIFTPEEGVSERNQNRVLINLHGGGFVAGWGTSSHRESLPIAALGRFKVVSIDYRHAPEYRFPAASEDVASVYRELLKQYLPENIGIFGCSAGGLLTAQSVAWFQHEDMPLPGAIGMFGAGAAYYDEGDSARLPSEINGGEPPAATHPYFGSDTLSNALAFPIQSREIM